MYFSAIPKDWWIGGINRRGPAFDFNWAASGKKVDNKAIYWAKGEPKGIKGTHGMRFWRAKNYYMDDYPTSDKCHYICECY
jgi:hypothetical protein